MNIIRNSSVESITDQGKKHIVVVCGGMSAEREVSLSSASGIIEGLVSLNYKVTKIDMGNDIGAVIPNLKPDIVFNALHGTYGEDGALAGLLNILRIPYTHSGLTASAIAMNKKISNLLFQSAGIRVINGVTINQGSNTNPAIQKPYVIKPLNQGSSIGIEIVLPEDEKDLGDYNFEYGSEILVEEYIKGKEIQVAVLNGKALGTLEIKLINKRFYDYQAKYTEGFTEHLIPGTLTDKQIEEVKEIAERANKVLGAKGLTRVEFILSEQDNEFYILELNTHPGFTPLSICPEIAQHHGICFTDLLEALIDDASFEE